MLFRICIKNLRRKERSPRISRTTRILILKMFYVFQTYALNGSVRRKGRCTKSSLEEKFLKIVCQNNLLAIWPKEDHPENSLVICFLRLLSRFCCFCWQCNINQQSLQQNKHAPIKISVMNVK